MGLLTQYHKQQNKKQQLVLRPHCIPNCASPGISDALHKGVSSGRALRSQLLCIVTLSIFNMEELDDIVYLSATVCLFVLISGILVCYTLRACRVPPTLVPDSWVFLLLGSGMAAILEFGASSMLERVVLAVDASFSGIYFAVLLPPVIFLAGLQLDLAGFFGRFSAICTFAFMGTFSSAIGIATIVFLCSLLPGMQPLRFLDAFVLGSILSATDTVAVIATFDSLSVRPELYSLVFGESVFNDAVAIVLFHTLASFENTPATLVASAVGVGLFVLTFICSTLIGANATYFST